MQLVDRLPIRRTRGRKGNVVSPDCPSRSVLEHLTSRWGVLVLIVLLQGTHRFSELARAVGGVSEKMLAQTLQLLEADGFVLRRVYPTVPPRVSYSLTPMGVEAATHVQVLTTWVENNLAPVLKHRSRARASSVVPA